jgi:hypothetical protein
MTPQNEGYYYAAYIVVAVLYGGYAFSLWRRARALKQGRPPE